MTKGAKLGRDLAIWGLIVVILYTIAALTRSQAFMLAAVAFALVGTPVAVIGALLRYNKTQKAEQAERAAKVDSSGSTWTSPL